MPRCFEIILMAVGAWTLAGMAVVGVLVGVAAWFDRLAWRRADRAAVAQLIRSARISSCWLHTESKGRG